MLIRGASGGWYAVVFECKRSHKKFLKLNFVGEKEEEENKAAKKFFNGIIKHVYRSLSSAAALCAALRY